MDMSRIGVIWDQRHCEGRIEELDNRICLCDKSQEIMWMFLAWPIEWVEITLVHVEILREG